MAVFNLLSSVAGFVKVRFLIDKAVIDNMVFRLHYRITSAILFVCCILCTTSSLIGECKAVVFWKKDSSC
jgi:Innexin.